MDQRRATGPAGEVDNRVRFRVRRRRLAGRDDEPDLPAVRIGAILRHGEVSALHAGPQIEPRNTRVDRIRARRFRIRRSRRVRRGRGSGADGPAGPAPGRGENQNTEQRDQPVRSDTHGGSFATEAAIVQPIPLSVYGHGTGRTKISRSGSTGIRRRQQLSTFPRYECAQPTFAASAFTPTRERRPQ